MWLVEPYEELTQTGRIRSLGMKGASRDIRRQLRIFMESGAADSLWHYEEGSSELLFHPILIDMLAVKRKAYFVNYFHSTPSNTREGSGSYRRIKIGKRRAVYVIRTFTTGYDGMDLEEIKIFKRLIIERMDEEEFKAFFPAYPIKEIRSFKGLFQDLEIIPETYPVTPKAG